MIKLLLIAMLLLGGLQTAALADVGDAEGTNVQDGDNSSDASQGGSADSGATVGGQVTGIVSSGDARVDARNRSEDVDLEGGEAHGINTSSGFTGLNSSEDTEIGGADIEGSC